MYTHILRYIMLLIILLCILAILYIVWYCFRLNSEIKQVEEISRYDSIIGFLRNHHNKKEIREITSKFDEDLNLLKECEYMKLAQILGRDYFFDLDENSCVPDKILSDAWNRRLLIAGRRILGKNPEWIIWSKGPDGIRGTNDDLVSADVAISPTTLENLTQD